MSALRLGIDGEALKRPLSGVGQYVLHLCRELEVLLPQAELFAYARHGEELIERPSTRWQLRSESIPLLRTLPSFAWLKTRGKLLCDRDRLQVFWAGRTLHPGLVGDTVTVSTVHDLNLHLVPETMQLSTRWSHRLWFERDVASANYLVANSRGTADRVYSVLGRRVDEVVLPGVDERFRRASNMPVDPLQRAGIPSEPYLLCVATLEPRKNVPALLRAFLELKRTRRLPDHKLVLVGARGWQGTELRELFEEAIPFGLVVAGYLEDALMPQVIAGADVLICASTYEGYGMPVLEARACGTRVVVSDTPELRESGGPNATIVRPNVEGIASGIAAALTRERLALDATDAQAQTWTASARRMVQLIERAASPLRP